MLRSATIILDKVILLSYLHAISESIKILKE